jgi:hypothetical protein
MAIKVAINKSIGTVQWQFSDGRIQTAHAERLHPAIRAYAALHGIKQKCGDAMALSAEDYGGRVPEQAKFDELKSMIEFLESGLDQWNQVRVGSGRVSQLEQDRALLMRALELAGIAFKAEKIAALKGNQITAMLVSEKLAESVALIRLEQTRDVDTEALFTELE